MNTAAECHIRVSASGYALVLEFTSGRYQQRPKLPIYPCISVVLRGLVKVWQAQLSWWL